MLSRGMCVLLTVLFFGQRGCYRHCALRSERTCNRNNPCIYRQLRVGLAGEPNCDLPRNYPHEVISRSRNPNSPSLRRLISLAQIDVYDCVLVEF